MRLLSEYRKWVLLLAVLLIAPPLWAKTPDKNDVRVLIDISGSMRKNDPNNLRRPALRMLVGLMQPGTRAGVWTFAKWANRLVPMAEVNKAWKKSALAKSKQITSPGQFTHVERVLEDAMKDWSGQPSSYNRHIVLLTDGMVDVSKVAGESAASRQRILDKLLPRLKTLGAKVHTVALSERADHKLMKKLSTETDGWYQQVETAASLQRVFLKIFEQVGKPDSVPLKGNKFIVDSSIREATLLIFTKPDSPKAVLVSPSGEKFTDSDLPAGVAWYRDKGYDLITIASPKKGEWTLDADIDSDNRVMIVTDLKLQTSELPAQLAVGEKIPFNATLTNLGKVVSRKAFLRVLDVRADALTKAGSDPQALNDRGEDGDSTASDGHYSMLYGETRAFDDVEILLSVESPTFMREKRFHIAVREPAKISIDGAGDGAFATVTVDDSVMRDGAEVSVWQDSSTGSRQELDLSAGGTGYALQDPTAAVYAQVEGQTRLGNLLKRNYGPAYADGVEVPEPEVTPAESKGEEKKSDENIPEEEQEEEEADDEMTFIYIFVGSNLAIVVIGLLVWLFIRKRRNAADEEPLIDDIEEGGELEVPEEAVVEGEVAEGDEWANEEAL